MQVFIWFCLEVWEAGCTKKTSSGWSQKPGECNGVCWNPEHKGELRVTPSRGRAETVILLCPVSWSDCFSRQVEDKQPCGHYGRTNPQPVQPRTRTNEPARLKMRIQRAACSLRQGVQDPSKPGAAHEQKRQDMVGKHSCPHSLNEK